jgi:hypothetical protein
LIGILRNERTQKEKEGSTASTSGIAAGSEIKTSSTNFCRAVDLSDKSKTLQKKCVGNFFEFQVGSQRASGKGNGPQGTEHLVDSFNPVGLQGGRRKWLEGMRARRGTDMESIGGEGQRIKGTLAPKEGPIP